MEIICLVPKSRKLNRFKRYRIFFLYETWIRVNDNYKLQGYTMQSILFTGNSQ